jgi:diguanylate cyclase (GGDEF)-like protein
VDRPPFAFSLQPDLRLFLLAMALTLAASLVSLSIFRHAGEGRGRQRVGWLLLAAATCAFGIWAAQFLSLIAHRTGEPIAFDWVLTTASLASVILLTSFGFAIASRPLGWHPAVGGAINGTGLGLMHYLGMYAVVLPGTIVWDVPLVLASIGVGVGFNAAALIAYQRLSGKTALWGAAALLTFAFFGLHFSAIHAARVVSNPALHAMPNIAHHWILAAIVVSAAAVVLAIGFLSMLIDRKTVRDNVETLQQLVDTAIDGIVLARDGRIAGVNGRIAELCGFARRDLIGKSIAGMLLEKPVALGASGETLLRTALGRRTPVKVTHQPLSSGDEVYAIHDLTERRSAEAELKRRNEILREREEELRNRNLLLDTALKHMSQGLCMYDKDERIVVCNERYATVYGLSPDAVKPGMSRREVIEMRIAKGIWAGASAESYLHQRTTPIESFGHLIQEMSDGRTISLVHVPMPGGGWVCTHEDITERRRAEAKIEHLARHDALTDLPNRFLLREELQGALQRMRPGDRLAVHCLDLDRFKEVNDAIGHAVGDELLQDFTARLRDLAGNGALVARTGGNEFVIVQNPARSPKDATDLAVSVSEAMAEPFVLGEHFQVVLSASIGIAMAPDDGIDADQLIKHANLALHRAKQEERGNYRFFEKEMDARMRARHELECNLRNALTDGELDLDFQPLLNLKRNEIACFEALLRWRTRSGEVIAPGEFVPLAEETGLIVPMGEWALRQALAEAAKWPRHIRVAVNLSPVQFNSRNLAQVVMSALAASGVEASRLELEITESLLLQDRETTLATLHQLRDLGVRIALDDFGTGFSSLNYLRAFPFDKLKIDRCFIAGLAEGNEESLAIVRAVARLGTSLGIATTAEGIETQVQMDVARREGFTEVQGFWIGIPESAERIAEEYDLYRRTTKPRRTAAGKARAKPAAEKPAPEVGERPKKAKRVRRARSA